jgi:hypothetical protein
MTSGARRKVESRWATELKTFLRYRQCDLFQREETMVRAYLSQLKISEVVLFSMMIN